MPSVKQKYYDSTDFGAVRSPGQATIRPRNAPMQADRDLMNVSLAPQGTPIPPSDPFEKNFDTWLEKFPTGSASPAAVRQDPDLVKVSGNVEDNSVHSATLIRKPLPKPVQPV